MNRGILRLSCLVMVSMLFVVVASAQVGETPNLPADRPIQACGRRDEMNSNRGE